MLGKASEIKMKQIVRNPLFSFNLEDHRKAKSLRQLLDDWLRENPDFLIMSIAFSHFERSEIANIIYKEGLDQKRRDRISASRKNF